MRPIEHSTLSKPIYETLKRMILDKELKPGDKIIQERIAGQLGVSRTPLMKALQTLEHELLVESIPRRGMFVRKVSIQEMIDVYYCRESIECMAIRLATERASELEIKSLENIFAPFINQEDINLKEYQLADEAFHNLAMDLSNNPILVKMSKLSQVPTQVYSLGLLRTPHETLEEHLKILNAMKKGDANLAEKEMKEHIRLSREILYDLNNK